ncbi:MAG: hypothetical protein ABFD18_02795 [Syntrophomonas sp.]
MDKIYKLAQGLMKRYPKGVEPYQMATRLAEECDEVASEICHWEDSGIKRLKHGEPSKEKMAGELKNVLSCVIQIAIYYGVKNELEQTINDSLARLKSEGYID